MAEIIRKTKNNWAKGLVMDFSPENTKNQVLTHALNATLLTFNGNELSLQNDMGNARVETAYLPEGYMPVGACEYGGIIYIVSYNPLEDKSQIGCFPSPERNVSSDELGTLVNAISADNFQIFDKNGPTGELSQNTQCVILKNDYLNPGDKFIITADSNIYTEAIKDLQINDNLFQNPIIALNIVSIEENGKIVYLNSDVRQYEKIHNGDTYKYTILGTSENIENQKSDIDSYRNIISSGYNVFKSKTSGKLAILAELIMIDSYNVTHSIQPKNDSTTNGEFDIIIHTDISPALNAENYYQNPKLKYYYLQKSNGQLELLLNNDIKTVSLEDSEFGEIKLNQLYTYDDNQNDTENLNVTLKTSGNFDFPKSETYHGRLETANSIEDGVYTKFFSNQYHRIHVDQLTDDNVYYFYNTLQANVYQYIENGTEIQIYKEETIKQEYTYYVKNSIVSYVNADRVKGSDNETLYIIQSNPEIAGPSIIDDPSIEKFQYQTTSYYKKASAKELEENTKTLYYKESGAGQDIKYTQLIGNPIEGVDYFILETSSNLISVGYVIDYTSQNSFYYYPNRQAYFAASEEQINTYFDFDTYPLTSNAPLFGAPMILYRKKEDITYVEATKEDLQNYNKNDTILYYNSQYKKLIESDLKSRDVFKNYQLFLVIPKDTTLSSTDFMPSEEHNWIKDINNPEYKYSKETIPLELFKFADFLPKFQSNQPILYEDVKLAGIKIPDVVLQNGLDLPFKYDYTIIPCMNYGKLNHLAVSNTVDFSKLHAFNQSGFHTWKYFIENNYLKLTFGTDVYDTYETNKVNGIIIEFYDLYGFVGSLEITDKKAYSGIFTKLIALNSPNSLNKYNIIYDNGDYKLNTNVYKRNIGIKAETKTETEYSYFYNNTEITWDEKNGWSNLNDSDNDCGTLYSNIIYKIKTYFRRSTSNGYEYIPKQDFFLYTLPIYNEYYYQIQNFNTLTKPKLKFVLTYKLQDNSNKVVYNNTDKKIVNGYVEDDLLNVQSYLKGEYQSGELQLTKYYKYEGTSKLYLEIGLHKNYENINMYSSPDLNELYNCELQLCSNDDKTKSFSINSDNPEITNIKDILNTEPDLSSLYFKTENGESYSLQLEGINKYNFLNPSNNTNPINLYYRFVVGYKAEIQDITETQIPATTICALCHKIQDNEYNYSDFGIYCKEIDGDTLYLSSAMVYNSGSCETESFGVCRQINIVDDDDNLENVYYDATTFQNKLYASCSSIKEFEQIATPNRTAFKLNTGEPLKNISTSIGKLTFCQPHVHGFYDDLEYGNCNIHYNPSNKKLVIPKEDGNWKISGHHDDAYGIVPSSYMLRVPRFNLSLNTIDSLKYYDTFISAIDYEGVSPVKISGWDANKGNYAHSEHLSEGIIFSGFTGKQVAEFNKCLITTMKDIYAYNPDYDLLTVNTGKVTLQEYSPIFLSNIINIYSQFKEGTNLNDHIYIGNVSVSKYLKLLGTHSNIEKIYEKEQVQFVADFEYCGTEDTPYLITSLTYKASIPEEYSQELNFNTSNKVVLKDSEGQIQVIEGVPNKKALYGYNKEIGKLIQLDVSNYTIDEDGNLLVNTPNIIPEDVFINCNKTLEYSDIKEVKYTKNEVEVIEERGYAVKESYKKARIIGTSITLNDLVYEPNKEGHRLFIKSGIHYYDSYLRNKIYYKKEPFVSNDTYLWDKDNKYLNCLYLAYGPCFTADNLKLNNNE